MSEYDKYTIESDGPYGLKVIKSKGSGALPNVLKGHFTSDIMAIRAIDTYNANKEVVNGEKSGSSRG